MSKVNKKYYKIVAEYKNRYWSFCTGVYNINEYIKSRKNHKKTPPHHTVEYRPNHWTLKRFSVPPYSHGLLYVYDNIDDAVTFSRYNFADLLPYSIWECEVRNPIPLRPSGVALVSGVKLIKKIY